MPAYSTATGNPILAASGLPADVCDCCSTPLPELLPCCDDIGETGVGLRPDDTPDGAIEGDGVFYDGNCYTIGPAKAGLKPTTKAATINHGGCASDDCPPCHQCCSIGNCCFSKNSRAAWTFQILPFPGYPAWAQGPFSLTSDRAGCAGTIMGWGKGSSTSIPQGDVFYETISAPAYWVATGIFRVPGMGIVQVQGQTIPAMTCAGFSGTVGASVRVTDSDGAIVFQSPPKIDVSYSITISNNHCCRRGIACEFFTDASGISVADDGTCLDPDPFP
jgi:hypothetical protein